MPHLPLILLVDDDPDFLHVYQCILEPKGYRVACASDPKEAWRSLEQETPDLIISDLMMDDLDAGFSLAREIKRDARFKHLPIIIATAITSQTGLSFRPKTPEDLAAMFADAFFDKPVPATSLLAKVAELLAEKHAP